MPTKTPVTKRPIAKPRLADRLLHMQGNSNRLPWWKKGPTKVQEELALIRGRYLAGRYTLSKNELRIECNREFGLNVPRTSFSEFLNAGETDAQDQTPIDYESKKLQGGGKSQPLGTFTPTAKGRQYGKSSRELGMYDG